MPMIKGSVVPTSGKGSKLQPKMQRFVDEYMKDMSPSGAYVRAGYKSNNPDRRAGEMMLHPLIKQTISERLDERREKNELSAQYVITKLIRIVEQTETDNPQAALRGLELLGKHLGMYRDKTEISGPDGKAIEMEQRITEDVADFTSRLSRLAERAGQGAVSQFPNPTSKG